MKALLIIPRLKKDYTDLNSEIEEFSQLAKTSGYNINHIEIIKIDKINPAYYIGSGKLNELKEIILEKDINCLLFDGQLSAGQQININDFLKIEIIDRNLLILKIFEQRATSQEGKIQVEMARQQYMLSRIYGKGNAMDQQVSVIGTRGLGEKKLEYERRAIKNKINSLAKKLKKIATHRETQREKRRSIPIPQISIVGYTNSGKSTLLNLLTRERHRIYSDDRLFATLDPLTKRVYMPQGYYVLFSDTVGFINKLPHILIAAFRSTLEEIKHSDIILHLHDISSNELELQNQIVVETLKEIQADNISKIDVINKIDLIDKKEMEIFKNKFSNAIFISAYKNIGLSSLFEKIESILTKTWKEYLIEMPYDKCNISQVEKYSIIKEREYLQNRIKLKIMATPFNIKKIEDIVNKP